jgi:hypothetical protein|tara:strand:+ start:101 stop:508 length:408 start_codon:yes stop_codon:yes gene_type:complete
MENLLGLSIVAGFVLSMFIMMIIKNLTRMVYANAKELDDLRGTPTPITSEDAWQQVLILEDTVLSLGKSNKLQADRVFELESQLSFHLERIDDDIHIEDIDVYDWIAERDAEFASSCKVSYRYNADGKVQDRYGK